MVKNKYKSKFSWKKPNVAFFLHVILRNVNKEAARLSRKVLVSAVANAENNLGLNKADLVVKEAVVNEGQTMKRMRFGSRGHVDPIKKRTSHIKIVVSDNK